MNPAGFSTGADRADGRGSAPSEAKSKEPGVVHGVEEDESPVPEVVFGTGGHYAWGRREEEFVIWRLYPSRKVVESFALHQQLEALQGFMALELIRGWRDNRWDRVLAQLRARPTLGTLMRQAADRTSDRWSRTDPSKLTAGILVMAFIGLVIYLTIVRGVGGGTLSQGVLSQEGNGLNPLTPGAEMPSRPGPMAALPSSLPGVNVHVNAGGGYLFSYPDSWELTSSGETDELVSLSGDVVMSFGVAPSGPLRQASDRVLRSLTSPYSDIRLVSDRAERTEQGQRGLVIGATATDANGAFVRLMAITIRGPDHNRAITVRFSASSDLLNALPAIRQIIGSFRTSAEENVLSGSS